MGQPTKNQLVEALQKCVGHNRSAQQFQGKTEHEVTKALFPSKFGGRSKSSGFYSTGIRNIQKPNKSMTLFGQSCGSKYLPDVFWSKCREDNEARQEISVVLECKLLRSDGDGSGARNAFSQLLDYLLAYDVVVGCVLFYDFGVNRVEISGITRKFMKKFSKLAAAYGKVVFALRLDSNMNVVDV